MINIDVSDCHKNLQSPITQDPTNAILCPNLSVMSFSIIETMKPDTNITNGMTAIMSLLKPTTVYCT